MVEANAWKDRFDESLDLFAHILNETGKRQKPVQLLMNKTDTLWRKMGPLPCSAPLERTTLHFRLTPLNSTVKSFTKQIRNNYRLYRQHISALDAKWMGTTLQKWQIMVLCGRLLEAGIM